MASPKSESRRMKRKIAIWEGAKDLVLQSDLSAIPRLVGALKRSKDTEERAAAAHALGGLHDKRALPALVSTLRNKKERPKVRGMAAEALGDFGHRNTQVQRELLSALSDRSAEVRFWSAFALGRARSRKAIPKLRQLAEKDKGEAPHWWSVAQEASDAVKHIEEDPKSKARPSKPRKRKSPRKRRA